jgi:hypothetical protein
MDTIYDDWNNELTNPIKENHRQAMVHLGSKTNN